MGHRIVRTYRSMGPTKFHGFNQTVRKHMADKARIPEPISASNTALFTAYLSTSDKHDAVYHESMLGSKLAIAEREVLQAQLVMYLDQIASLLEMAAVCNPEILLTSGFDLSKDRRGRSRGKVAAAVLNAAHANQEEGGSGTAN